MASRTKSLSKPYDKALGSAASVVYVGIVKSWQAVSAFSLRASRSYSGDLVWTILGPLGPQAGGKMEGRGEGTTGTVPQQDLMEFERQKQARSLSRLSTLAVHKSDKTLCLSLENNDSKKLPKQRPSRVGAMARHRGTWLIPTAMTLVNKAILNGYQTLAISRLHVPMVFLL